MAIQRLSYKDFTVLQNLDIQSEQIVWPRNAPDAQVTITRVTMQRGAVSGKHSHPRSEQTWLVEKGTAMLLMKDGQSATIKAGDVVRTPAGEVHGVEWEASLFLLSRASTASVTVFF